MTVISHNIPRIPRIKRNSLNSALIITRREIKDSLRDWRIMTPIFILTLIFPVLMNFVATIATDWVAQYDATIVGERLIPFMLLVVGFFPISFSLVIALETFVGEKERSSIEPLLSMPITDLELYVGKMLAALFLPLAASYLGISVYLTGLYIFLGWLPDWSLFWQIFLLTTVEGLVMVSGAVVVSSQTTSVRASNLLASFIIVPMALLLQGESILLFWGKYYVIWFIILGLLVVSFILIRMGVRIFNREDILSKEMDTLSLRTIGRDFKGYFLRPPQQALNKDLPHPKFNLLRIWRHDIPQLLKNNKVPLAIVSSLLIIATIGGIMIAPSYPLPADSLNFSELKIDEVGTMKDVSLIPTISSGWVFLHNVRVNFVSALLSIITFGVISLVIVMAPLTIIGYFIGAVNLLGYNAWLFVAAVVLPHGLIEIPANVIAAAFMLKLGAGLVSPPQDLDIGQGLLLNLANLCKIFIFLLIPLFFIAAIIETQVTVQIVNWVYTGT